MSAADVRLRRLPLVDRPFRRETIRSFLARLVALNHLEHARLAEFVEFVDARLDRHELRFPSNDILTKLSTLTGFPAARLALAFPPRHQPGPEDFTLRPWLAFRFCSAGRRPHGAPVKQWPLMTSQVSFRHRRWIGSGRRVNDRQLDLAGAPAILAAACRHQALPRRVGPILATTTISEAVKVVEENLHIGPVPHELRTRLSALIRVNVDSRSRCGATKTPLWPRSTRTSSTKPVGCSLERFRARGGHPDPSSSGTNPT
jgi:hypothetical protein